MDWQTYWRDVVAPRLLEKKEALGRAMPEREIASYVEAKTGKPSGRGLVWSWLHGEREPFMSQFLALCEKLEVEPLQILAAPPTRQRRAAIHGNERTFSSRKPDRAAGKKYRSGTSG